MNKFNAIEELLTEIVKERPYSESEEVMGVDILTRDGEQCWEVTTDIHRRYPQSYEPEIVTLSEVLLFIANRSV